MPSSSRRVRSLRVALRRVMAAVAVIALVAGIASQGQRLFYCALMGEITAAPCCEHRASKVPAIEADLDPCCETLVQSTLPSAAVSDMPAAPAAPLAAILPALPVAPALARATSPRMVHLAPTGPPASGRVDTVVLRI